MGELSPSLPPPYPPFYRLCSFQLAARPSFAFWLVWDHSSCGLGHSSPLASSSLKLSAEYKMPRPIWSSFLISFSTIPHSHSPLSQVSKAAVAMELKQLKRWRELFYGVCQGPKTSEVGVRAESLGFPNAPVLQSEQTFNSPPSYSLTQCSTPCSDSEKFSGELGSEILSHAWEPLHVKADSDLPPKEKHLKIWVYSSTAWPGQRALYQLFDTNSYLRREKCMKLTLDYLAFFFFFNYC